MLGARGFLPDRARTRIAFNAIGGPEFKVTEPQATRASVTFTGGFTNGRAGIRTICPECLNVAFVRR